MNFIFIEFSIACGSLAITCAGLSIIAIWLSGFYFQARRRTKQTSCALLSMSLLLLLICKFVDKLIFLFETIFFSLYFIYRLDFTYLGKCSPWYCHN